MSEVTRLLNALDAGDPRAAEQLWPIVYDELRRLAAAQMARERPGQTLDATGLVHEAYLRLVAGEGGEAGFANHRHFFAAASEAMRRILIDNARRKLAAKRGGARVRADVDLDSLAAPQRDEDLLVLDEALTQLAQVDAVAARLVQLRYFAGLSIPEAAAALELAPRSADRLWAFARAWLYRELKRA
jgi:RNA polymerase sigma factor (TIGR02999 family)